MTESSSLHADLSKAFQICFGLCGKGDCSSSSRNAPTDNTAKPVVPDKHTIKKAFCPALKKWRDGKYTPANSAIPLMTYVLPGGNESDPSQGLEGLTSSAASIVNSLAPIAKGLGFSVFTAGVTKQLIGIPHEDDFTYEFIPSHYKRRRLGFDDELYDLFCENRGHGSRYNKDFLDDYYSYKHGDYDTPRMGEVLKEKLLVDHLASADEANALSMKLGEFRIEEDDLIAPKNEFEKSYPQHEAFDRGNGEITLEYKRSVVVLCPSQEETDLILALKGPYWFLKHVDVTSAPSARAKAVVSAAIRSLDAKEAGMRSEWSNWRDETSPSSTAQRILAHATAWRDHVLWSQAMHHCQTVSTNEIIPAVKSALEVFEVELIKDGLTSLIMSTNGLRRRGELIDIISAQDQNGTNSAWIEELLQQALSLCTKPTLDDMPILVSITKAKGPKTILSLIPNIEKTGTYEPLMALARALYKLYQSADTSAHDKCPAWGESELVTTKNAATERVCEIVVFCYTINHLQPCIDLFNSLCQFKPDAYITGRLRGVHAPLSIHLKTTLTGLGRPLNVEPFASFYRNTISLYLARVLGAKPILPPLPSKAVGCGCPDCTQLDTFLRGPEEVTSFKATHLRRSHVEAQIRKEKLYLEEYVTTHTEKYGSPHTLYVHKCDEIVAALKWDDQKKQAEAFVKCVCPYEKGLREVMGGRYGDVVSALDGTRAFVLGDLVFAGDTEAEHKSTSKSARVTAVISIGSSANGTKRKRK